MISIAKAKSAFMKKVADNLTFINSAGKTVGFELSNLGDDGKGGQYTASPSNHYVKVSVTIGSPVITLRNGDQESANGFCQIDVNTTHNFGEYGHDENSDRFKQIFEKGIDAITQSAGQVITINDVAISPSIKDETHYLSAITVNFRVIG